MTKYHECRECGGKGQKWCHALNIFTYGLGYLFGVKEKCPRCLGVGYLSETRLAELESGQR